MAWDPDFLAHMGETQGSEARIKIKRRKFGKFIGLRGCETPVEEVDERSRWLRRREDMMLKTEGIGYWGRGGWRRW